MASGLLSLKWNNHRTTFFHVLSTIRNKESYCDATIACDGKFYPVHKLVLSTCSDYFEQMFERTNCKHPIIVLKDIRHEDLEALLNYMYVGEVNVLQNELAGLIKAAECLMIKGLAVPDEAPTKDSKRVSVGSREDSPQAKRRRRDDDSSGRSVSQNQQVPREAREPSSSTSSSSQSQRQSTSASIPTPSSAVSRTAPPAISPSPSVGSASDALSEDASQGHIESTDQPLPNAQESKQLGSEQPSSQQESVPEVILDEPGVKEEPQEVEDEVTETKDILESQFSFDALPEGESRSDPGGSGGTSGFDNQMLPSQPQSVEELVAQAIPGSSGLQGNSVSLWEGDGSLQGFPMESFGGDGSRPPQMGADMPNAASMKHHEESMRTTLPRMGADMLEPASSRYREGTMKTVYPLSRFMPSQDKRSGASMSANLGRREFRCHICGHQALNESRLAFHCRKHTPDPNRREYKCQTCGYQALSESKLTMHYRKHTGEKPFTCAFCSYRSAQKSNLSTHIKNVHKEWGGETVGK